ncbi:MAG: TetR/AcrR family transcriptional regulator [Capsulimonadaceae bacterium]|nr:TetR/AcrR family transcriptional regulator [Capsulimonadaceae bacterium]
MEKRENQKENLLRAACELVAENGIAPLRTRDIAKRAGLSHGTLHYCFATKEELLKALYQYIRSEFRHATEHLEHEDPQLRESLEGQARLRLHLLHSPDTLFLAWRAFTREAWTEPLVGQIVKAHYAEQRKRFEAILARGRAGGALPATPSIPDSVTAAMILSFYEGLTVQWTLDPESVDPDAYVQGLHKLLGLGSGNV